MMRRNDMIDWDDAFENMAYIPGGADPVSYTHLTLPTTPYV